MKKSLPQLNARIANLENELRKAQQENAYLRQILDSKDHDIGRVARDYQDLQGVQAN